jgi:hypothetical protein
MPLKRTVVRAGGLCSLPKCRACRRLPFVGKPVNRPYKMPNALASNKRTAIRIAVSKAVTTQNS